MLVGIVPDIAQLLKAAIAVGNEMCIRDRQWALDTQKGRRNLEKWELGKIALKLKPEIEAKARANQGTRTDLSATLPESSDRCV